MYAAFSTSRFCVLRDSQGILAKLNGDPVPGSTLANLNAARLDRALGGLHAELLNGFAQPVIATDVHGYVVFWNRAAERLYGWAAEEVCGRNIQDITPSSERRAAPAAMMERLKIGESWSGEFQTRHKDGHAILVELTNYSVHDAQGTLNAIVGIARPVQRGDAKPEDRRWAPHSVWKRACAGFPWVFAPRGGGLGQSLLARRAELAVLLLLSACAGRVLLDVLMPQQLPYLSFFPAVVIASFLCGSGPTSVLIAASAFAGTFWPSGTEVTAHSLLAAGLFSLSAALVAAPALYAAKARRLVQQRDDQLLLINRELKHRLQNLFAITSSVCQQTIKSDAARETLATIVAGRIEAIAKAQDLLSPSEKRGSDFRALAEAILAPLCPDSSRLSLSGPDFFLPVEATTAFALILHELATNALKYGAWGPRGGHVSAGWKLLEGRKLEFTWRENSAESKIESSRTGFGTLLIARALPHADVRHEIGPNGACCSVKLPL
jgi:PAS domain S-box-containing protein